MKSANITDVARRAGVSTATVSRVLNNPELVKPETIERVTTVIKEFNYTPSALAQGLSKRSTSTVGLIVPEISNKFFANIIRGVTEVADENNLSLICFDSNESVEKDIRAIDMFKRQRVMGLLLTCSNTYGRAEDKKKILDAVKSFGENVVLLDRRMDFLGCPGVYFDDDTSVYDAICKLIKAGHRRIASINGNMDVFELSQERQYAYEAALRDNGIEVDSLLEYFGEYDRDTGYKYAKDIFSRTERPTAVITFNNSLSYGFIRACVEMGVSIPEDIVLVGLDRIDEIDTFGIKMNYIERDSYLMGKYGMKKIVSMLSDEHDSEGDITIRANVSMGFI